MYVEKMGNLFIAIRQRQPASASLSPRPNNLVEHKSLDESRKRGSYTFSVYA